ncbi:hypothetical protein COU37_01700 [Candidatus Micrarchaeota archaeon CG10_big_fil_rev_8_21_14_0_10_45_29]|nr:MAG: hypothetical protein COU37_01700 [Candidatus Micrarchaeota archaeon CG10_big_fil_rev_8_21_14_0_10_45_29]
MSYLNAQAPLPRQYQSDIADAVINGGSALVVLPTGMGKTLVALLVANKKLDEGNVLFLAPTRPLAAQHEQVCRKWLNLKEEEISLVSGLISAKERPKIYAKEPKILLSTPQTIANDLEAGRLKWDFSLCIFDEVHRAVGKYAYTKVAKEALAHNTMVLGLTASPGAQKKKIQEILDALGIKNVQIRTHEDEDVKKYIKQLQIKWIEVPLTLDILQIKMLLEKMASKYSTTLKKMGFFAKFNTKKSMAEMRAKILASNSKLKYSAISFHASLFSSVHMLELLETQGVQSLRKFISRVKERDESKAQQRILSDANFAEVERLLEKCAEHPKLAKLVQIIKERPAGEKFIVFSQYRDQVDVICKELGDAGLLCSAFMGKKGGVTQKIQAKTIERFREGKFDILVATSIGEEGLDIPSVDNVIFFEPAPSEIRAIQRRGRAGRAKIGNMFGLIAKGTRDEAFFWASRKREEKMQKIVGKMSLQNSYAKKREEESCGEKEKESGKKRAGKEKGGEKDSKFKNKGKKAAGQSRLSDF